MKRIILTIFTLTISIYGSHAQSLDDLLKSLGGLMGSSSEQTEQAKENKPAHPSEQELANKWVFHQLEMDYEGNDPLATVAIATAQQQLPTLATKAGLTANRDYIKFKDDKTMICVSGERKASATYSYIPPTGMVVITLTNNDETIRVSATATTKEGKLYMMFKANELIALAIQTNPQLKEDSMFAVAQTLCTTYPGITIGMSFE